MMRVEAKRPIKYEILLEDQGEGTWILDYAEYFTKKDWEEAVEDTKALIKQMQGFFDVKLDATLRKAYYTLTGPKNLILNMIASEFLSVSDLGEMSLKQLFALVVKALADAGYFEKKKEKE